jgi:hypothetical protein
MAKRPASTVAGTRSSPRGPHHHDVGAEGDGDAKCQRVAQQVAAAECASKHRRDAGDGDEDRNQRRRRQRLAQENAAEHG